MTSALVGLARDGALLALALLAPLVVAAVIAGAMSAIIGAVTQVRDAALGFAPRLAAIAIAVVITAPVIATRLQAFTTRAMAAIPAVGRGDGVSAETSGASTPMTPVPGGTPGSIGPGTGSVVPRGP